MDEQAGILVIAAEQAVAGFFDMPPVRVDKQAEQRSGAGGRRPPGAGRRQVESADPGEDVGSRGGAIAIAWA